MKDGTLARMVYVGSFIALLFAACVWIDQLATPGPASIERELDRVCPAPDIILEWTCPDCDAIFVVAGKATRKDLQVFVSDHRENCDPNQPEE